MDFFKNLFGDGKPEYSDKIPEVLKPEQFGIYTTFLHGLLSQPSCIAYDSVQYLVAIGSHNGSITVIGKPALEKHFSQPNRVPVVQLVFIENKGFLISRCTDNSIYLWNIKDKLPYIEHTLEFLKEMPCLMNLSYLSQWLYVGMEGGNVHIVNTETFEVSGYTIYWDKVTAHEAGHRNRPGDTIGIQEHPLDPSKVLLAYSGGLIVLWNIKNKLVEKRFKLHKNNTSSILLSVDWNSSGKHFAAAYSDGSIGVFNLKNEGKPEKQYHPHGSIGSSSPIIKLQWIVPDGADPLFIFSGGFPDGGGVNVKSLTFHDTKSTSLLNFEQPIVDFLSLSSSPHVTDAQRLFAVVILTETELIVHDLQSQNYPMFGVPFSFNINQSPVTALGYYGNCPDDFVAELQSVLSKIPQEVQSTRRWPLTGGRWGQEAPDPWTDLILTGHANGAVKVWYCRSVISQPLFTIELSNYLKETSKKKTNIKPPQVRSPSAISPPVASKSSNELTTPTQLTASLEYPSSGTDEPDTPTTSSPRFFRLNSEEDGNLPSPKVVKRKATKIFGLGSKKTKKISAKPKVDKVLESHDQDSDPSEPSSPASGGGLSPKQSHSTLPRLNEQQDGAGTSAGDSPKLLPPSKSASSPALPMVPPPEQATPTTRVYTPLSPSPSSESYTVLSLTDTTMSNGDNTSVNYIHMEPQAQTLCIATRGGHTLCMDFSLKPVDRAPQSININFAEDSIIKPDEADTHRGNARPNKLLPNTPDLHSEVSFTNDKDKTLPGFHVLQHCFNFYSSQAVHVSNMRYNKHRNILVMGTDHGLAIVDVGNNSCIKTLGYLDSILYVADPSSYSRQCRKIVEEVFPGDGSSHKPRQLTKTNSEQLLSPLIINATESNSTKIISDTEPQVEEEVVTNVEIVEMFVNKSGESSLTMWVSLKCGKVCVYIVNTVSQHGGKQHKIDLLPSGIVLDMKSAVINMIFLSEWGERLINPYMTTDGGSDSTKSSPAIVAIKKRRRMSSKVAVETEKSVNYVVISTRDKIKSIGFPSNHNISEIKPNLSNGLVVGCEFLSCDGLPCIVSWSTCGHILIHTLPGLKPMLQVNHTPLLDYRSLHSFRLSCDGQGLYLATPSQFQRFSLLKSNQLNYPSSLPDIYVAKDDPHPASKGIFQALFKQGTSVDRNDFFGIEAAGKAWRSVAKRDENLEQTRREQLMGKGKRGPSSAGTGTGAGNALEEARLKLDKRGKDLSELEQRTEQLQDDAADFANVARLLAEKQKRKKIF